jgi:HD-GYP domain-containing protein (c-di-GMP phosphodiesterase class II)
VIVAAFIAALASIALVTELQERAGSSRDAQVTVGRIEQTFHALQSVPYDGIGAPGAAAWVAVQSQMQADERLIERTLDDLERQSPTRHLVSLAGPYKQNIAVLERIRSLLERGMQNEADKLGPVAGRLQRAVDRDLRQAGIDYRNRAADSLTLAKFGAGGAILALVSLFGVFYLRSRKVAADAGRLTKENARLQVQDAQLQVIQRLARAAEYRDDNTGEHIRRVGDLAARIGGALGLPGEQLDLLREAAPLHDVGKIAIPDRILLKPGPLTRDEFEQMKDHATLGAAMLSGREFPLLAMAEEIALTHHERWDGTGYPAGLSGRAIPQIGRIVAVADVFDALTHSRSYKEAWTVDAAVAEIGRQKGRQFDPAVVAAFMLVLPEFIPDAADPTGSRWSATPTTTSATPTASAREGICASTTIPITVAVAGSKDTISA